MPGSRACRRVLVALLLAAACLAVGGALTAATAAVPAAGSVAQPDPARPAASTLERTSTVPVTVRTYTVRAGDNLSSIAMRHRYPGGWQRLYAHNRRTVGADPDLIHPGQVLRLSSLTPRSSRKPAPAARPAAVTPPPAPAASDLPRPVEPATGSATSPLWRLVQPAGALLAVVGLLAALTVARRRRRQSERPVTRSRPAPERRPAPQSHPAARSHPRPDPTRAPTPPLVRVTDPPPRGGPIRTVRPRPVSFSLVVVADGQRGEDLAALLTRLGGLDHPQLGTVVVVGQDDRAARSAADQAARRHPDRITVVTNPQRPHNAATAIDAALPVCDGEVTGVLGATSIHPELLDCVAGHVRDNGATMIRIGTQLESCWWSSSRAPGRFRLRLLPGRGQLVFVRTELLRAEASQDERPTRPVAGHGRATDDELRLHLARLRVLRKAADAHLLPEADHQPDGFIRLLLAELDAVDRLGGELLGAGGHRRGGAG